MRNTIKDKYQYEEGSLEARERAREKQSDSSDTFLVFGKLPCFSYFRIQSTRLLSPHSFRVVLASGD